MTLSNENEFSIFTNGISGGQFWVLIFHDTSKILQLNQR